MKINNLAWQPSSQYDDDLLLDVRAGTVALLVRGRNAWHTTWVQHFFQHSLMFTNELSAKENAERLRQRGSVFYVREAPALMLVGREQVAVLCDANRDNPFGGFSGFTTRRGQGQDHWISGIFPGVSVVDAIACFHHLSGFWKGAQPSEHSLRSGIVGDAGDIDQSHRRLRSWTSRAQGSNYYLAWDFDTNNYRRHGVARAVRSWRDAVKNVDPGDGSASDWGERLRRYRDHHLQVAPRSEWLRDRRAKAEASLEAIRMARRPLMEALRRVDDLQQELWNAEEELDEAREARFQAADTSDGLRLQRERFEAATDNLVRLRAALDEAHVVLARRRMDKAD